MNHHTHIKTGILNTDTCTCIYDHFQIFTILESINRKTKIAKHEAQRTYRHIDDNVLQNIINELNSKDWSTPNNMNVEDAFNLFVQTLQESIDLYSPYQSKYQYISKKKTWAKKPGLPEGYKTHLRKRMH